MLCMVQIVILLHSSTPPHLSTKSIHRFLFYFCTPRRQITTEKNGSTVAMVMKRMLFELHPSPKCHQRAPCASCDVVCCAVPSSAAMCYVPMLHILCTHSSHTR
mmetsp:Transcript_29565/g.55312  ORF Transcript_29565/g.55312 Transcript_29565/m.55312 type:complete len:104 (+) Transcript_29565:348-659(+)